MNKDDLVVRTYKKKKKRVASRVTRNFSLAGKMGINGREREREMAGTYIVSGGVGPTT